MQFTAMPLWLFTGLAVLAAGVLAILQFLLIRPRRVRIITTLFWRQASEQALARTLFERFRHPLTWLLLLVTSLLVLLALAVPLFLSDRQPHRVIALEAGLSMTAPDQRFEKARDLVRREASALNENRVAVITADPLPRLLKHFDESMVDLEKRLSAIQPADTPVIRNDLLGAAASMLTGRSNGERVLVTAEPAALDDDAVRVLPAGKAMNNAFVLSALFIPDATDHTRGSFHCRVGFTGKENEKISVAIRHEDESLLEQSGEFRPGDVKPFIVPDLSADGRVLTVSLKEPGLLSGDNELSFPLPDRPAIAVSAISGTSLPSGLASVIKGLPAVSIDPPRTPEQPVITVGPPGSGARILVQPIGTKGDWGPVLASPHPMMRGLSFEDALCQTPSEPRKMPPKSLPLLRVHDTPLVALHADGTRATLLESALDEEASLIRRTGYMVFWSRLLHRLAGWKDEPVALTPLQAAHIKNPSSHHIALKADPDRFDPLSVSGNSAAVSGGSGLQLWQWLLACAFFLMLLETALYLRKRIS